MPPGYSSFGRIVCEFSTVIIPDCACATRDINKLHGSNYTGQISVKISGQFSVKINNRASIAILNAHTHHSVTNSQHRSQSRQTRQLWTRRQACSSFLWRLVQIIEQAFWANCLRTIARHSLFRNVKLELKTKWVS